MQLKSLEMLGFKSFRNRTKVSFTDGITALVGPNGCGKTNIVDAVRWVLGELSPSMLRCDRMGDIIFSGASDKKELGVAEVTLTILNDDGEIPLDYSEIAITRKLYRSSESEYYINRKLCRLKDIHNLFLNTGISYRTYSMFENAMIDRILAKDPIHKRLFFEEASKIAKYRERKSEVLRKLETTENDVKNLKEVIAEAERYTSSLKRQASRARRHSEVKEELSFLKASSLKENYVKLKQQIASESKKLEQIKVQKNGLLETLNCDEQEMEEITPKSDSIETSTGKFQQELKKLDESLGGLEKDIISCKERIKAEKDKLKHTRKELDANIKAKERTADSVRSNRARLDQAGKELETCRRKLTEIEREIETMGESDLLETRDRLLKKESAISKRVMEFETSSDNRAARVRSIETDMESVSREQREARKSLDTWDKSISNLLSEEHTLKRRIDEVEEEKDSCGKEIAQLEGQLSRVSVQLNGKGLSPSPWIESSYAVLKDCISMDPRYERAIVGALGIRLMAPLIDSQKDLLKIVESLREQKASRSVLLRPSSQPATLQELPQEPSVRGKAIDFVKATDGVHEARRALEWLLADHVVVTNLTAALRLSEAYPNLSFSTLDGDVLQNDGTVWTGLFEKEQKDALEELRKTHATLSEHLSRIEPDFESLREEYSNIQLKRVRLETENNRLLSEREKLEKRVASLASDLSREKKEVSAVQKKLEKENKELSQARKEISDMELSLSSAGKDRETLQTERNDLLIELRVSEERISTLGREIERSKVLLKENKETLKELEENLSTSSNFLKELETKLGKRFDRIELLINRRNGALEEKNEAEKEKASLQERIGYLTERRKLIRNDVDRLGETSHQTEMKLMELTGKRTSLRDNTASEYGIDLEQFELTETPNPQKVEKLENSLRRLGVVNPLAMEEYEKEKERLDFLRTQLNDLTLAKKYLLDTITFIDERATSQFKETFAKVKRNFKTVFTKLFEGGVADLRLGNDSDVFCSSIELVANPRGKKLKSLDALSGGERALVAIAFLFSLYLCRPSPFCILDEIDAALDDANVVRFLAFLKELRANTQFLIVTHNKRTMEAANSLYGITMQDPGISKIVSVKLEER